MSPDEPTYPWLRLLELELEQQPKPVERRRPGRPSNRFPRKRVRMSLTEDEQGALDALVDLLAERMGRGIHRGHLVAFMAFRLQSQLQNGAELALPEGIDSFQALARYLDSGG